MLMFIENPLKDQKYVKTKWKIRINVETTDNNVFYLYGRSPQFYHFIEAVTNRISELPCLDWHVKYCMSLEHMSRTDVLYLQNSTNNNGMCSDIQSTSKPENKTLILKCLWLQTVCYELLWHYYWKSYVANTAA